MPVILNIILAISLAFSLTACGVKGKLKTPDQIEKLEEKQAAKEAKEARDKTTKNADHVENSVEKK